MLRKVSNVQKSRKNNIENTHILFNFFSDFRERGRKGEREGEKHQCERETLIDCLLYAPLLGSESATQACALMGIELMTFQFAG